MDTKRESQIVAGGGWVTTRRPVKRKARVFGVLSLVWVAVDVLVLALIVVGAGEADLSVVGYVGALGVLWKGLAGVVLLHPAFLLLAVGYGLYETPEMRDEEVPISRTDGTTLH